MDKNMQTPPIDEIVDSSTEENNGAEKGQSLFDKIEKSACTLGAIALTLMAVVLGSGIISRYLFDTPIPGVYDIVQLLLIWVVFLSLSFTQKEERHIRVEIILRRLAPRTRIYFDIGSTIVGFVLCLLMSWQAAKMAWNSAMILEYWPGLLRVPIYPSKIVLCIGIALLTIRFLLDTMKSIRKLRFTGNVE